MKLALFTALALIVIVDQVRSEEKCLFDRTKPTAEPTCLHIKLSTVAPTNVTTIPADASTVAAMTALPQIDTAVKELAAE